MMQAALIERIAQRAHHMGLAHHIGKAPRTIAPGQGQISHYRRLPAEKGGNPHPLNPGTRIRRCRCSLPGLTGFTAYRRGGLMRVTIEILNSPR